MPPRPPKPPRSRHAPYVGVRTPIEVVPYLPSGPDAVLTSDLVRRFVKETRRRPDVRLAVLGTLRAHAVTGAEAPLAGFGIVIAALALVLSVGVTAAVPAGWIVLLWTVCGTVVVAAALWVLRVASAAHTRRVTATVWLGAYEDALS